MSTETLSANKKTNIAQNNLTPINNLPVAAVL